MLFRSETVLGRRQQNLRTLADNATRDPYDIGWSRGFLAAMEYMQHLPSRVVDQIERIEDAEARAEEAI